MNERENVSIFDLLPPETGFDSSDCLTWCDSCLFCEKGCCSYNTRDRACVLGSGYSPDFHKMQFEQVIEYISKKLELPIKKGALVSNYVDHYQEYVGESGNISFEIHLDEYYTGIPYISLDVKEKGVAGGFGCPCDSIDEVIETLKRKIRLYG